MNVLRILFVAVVLATAALVWGNRHARSQEVVLGVPPVMCDTADELKALVAERNKYRAGVWQERRDAWFRAINALNKSFGPPRCVDAEGDGVFGQTIGQVLVDNQVFDIREADFYSLVINGHRLYGAYRYYVLVPRPQLEL